MKYIKYFLGYLFLVSIVTGVGYGMYILYDYGYSMSVIILLSLYVVNFSTTLVIFVQYRHSGAKLSWLLAMAMFPLLGHLLFFIFGLRYKNREELDEYRKRNNFKYENYNPYNLIHVDEKYRDVFKRQSHITQRGVYKADIKLYKTGDCGYDALFEDLSKAKKFIHMHYYIIKPGEIYEQFKNILIKRAKAGVKVRLIVDDFGRWALPWYQISELKKHGIEVAIFGKVSFPFIGSENGFRTHRKLAIIDGKTVHTGGLNIGDEYANISKKYGLWIDLQAKITGEAVRSYSLLFIEDWKTITGQELKWKNYLKEDLTGKSRLTMIEDSPENKVPIMQDSIVQMILNAKTSIHLATPYFIPSPEVFAALRTAALAGVDVNIYIPGKADKKTVIVATRYYANILKTFGAKIKVTNDILIHSKIGMFDETYAYFGTANLDIRSLYAQFEILSLVAGEVIEDVKDLFKYYNQFCSPIENKEQPKGKIKDKLLRIYVNMFSPIM